MLICSAREPRRPARAVPLPRTRTAPVLAMPDVAILQPSPARRPVPVGAAGRNGNRPTEVPRRPAHSRSATGGER